MKKYFLLFSFYLQLLPVMYAQWQPTNGPYGGSIIGMVIKDQNIFAVTMQQGVFTSTDNGSSWSEKNNGVTSPNGTCITVKGNRMYLGTQAGFFISDDKGNTWNTMLINGLANFQVNALGSNTQSVLALIGDTLYRSNDDGNTWSSVLYNYGLRSLGVNGNTIFVGGTGSILYRSVDNGVNFWAIDCSGYYGLYDIWDYAFTGSAMYVTGAGGYVFRSYDNGDTWTEIDNGLDNPGGVMLAANGNKIYCGLYLGNGAGYGQSQGGLYVSSDEGAHWTYLGLRGYIVEQLVFSGNRMIAGTWSAGIFISDDDGLTWNNSSDGLMILSGIALMPYGSSLFASCVSSQDYYGSVHYFVMRSADQGMSWPLTDNGLPNEPINTFASGASFILAGSTRVYISYDNGGTWQMIFNPGFTINALLVTGPNIFTGTSGGIFLSGDGGIHWHSVNNGLENTTVVSMISRGNTLFAGTASGVFRSVDNGSTWTAARNGIEGYNVNAIASNSNFLFASGQGPTTGIFRSADNGDNWTRVDLDFPYYNYASSLAVSNEKVIAGTFDVISEVIFSADNGQTWSVVNTGLPVGYGVPSLTILGSTVYAALSYQYPYYIPGAGVWKRPLSDFIPFILGGDTVVMTEKAGDLKTLGITSSTPWILQGTMPIWLGVDKTSGNGSDVLTFATLLANPSQQKRYASLEVISEGITRYCTVVQKEKVNGIEDLLSPVVSIYPNPTSGSIIIESDTRYDKLTVYSAPGQVLSEQLIVSPKTQLDLSRYGRGVYYIRLSGEKGLYIKEVVVL
jgi:photosystem II stability/assembly factor-like uncharacterized protein